MKVLSLGCGIQSSCLAFMSEKGEIDKYDFAIFADTQNEPKSVYKYLSYIQDNVSFPVHVVTKGNLMEDFLGPERACSIPLYTKKEGEEKEGKLWRQCTQDYKLAPIYKFLRSTAKSKEKIFMSIGISLDEIQRAKKSKRKYVENVFPLLENRMTRIDCRNWIQKNNYKLPVKSACIFCPFHSNSFWLDMRNNRKDEWKKAVEFDKKVRDIERIDSKAFVHRSLVPLDEVNLENPEQETFGWEECEGMCGI